jgi:hypothetical protein
MPMTAADTRSLGIRSNNPFNLQESHIPWMGELPSQSATGEITFDTMVDGIRAGVKVCYAYQKEGFDTPAAFIPRYAPAEAGNPTLTYLSNVCSWTGFGSKDKLDFHDPLVMQKWARALWRQEQGLAAAQAISFEELQAGIEAAQK